MLDLDRSSLRGAVLSIAVLSFLAAGCGGAPGPDHPVATVEGRVTIDGAPVETGRIQFSPIPPTKGAITGGEIQAGRYKAQLAIGKHRVTFTATRDTGRVDTTYSQPVPILENIVPTKYAQGIEVEITGPDSAKDFALAPR